MLRRMRWLVVIVLLAVTGCSGGDDETVRKAVSDFYAAVSASDGSGACDLLAPETRSELESSSGSSCSQAVLDEVDPANGTPTLDVFGDGARARVGDDTAFLARFEQGWLVTAAGCSGVRRRDQPYDCDVQGG
jgi:hypothetical protein